jgi:hypothetical protein
MELGVTFRKSPFSRCFASDRPRDARSAPLVTFPNILAKMCRLSDFDSPYREFRFLGLPRWVFLQAQRLGNERCRPGLFASVSTGVLGRTRQPFLSEGFGVPLPFALGK